MFPYGVLLKKRGVFSAGPLWFHRSIRVTINQTALRVGAFGEFLNANVIFYFDFCKYFCKYFSANLINSHKKSPIPLG
jgi:hypothetical protein